MRAVAASIAAQKTKPPGWMVCDADKFVHYWLAGWESGKIPRPTKAEADKADEWIVDGAEDDDLS